MLGKKDESVLALLTNVGKEKFYCVKSLLQARYLIHATWKSELPKFKAAVTAAYPLAAQFAQPKPKDEQPIAFETPRGE